MNYRLTSAAVLLTVVAVASACSSSDGSPTHSSSPPPTTSLASSPSTPPATSPTPSTPSPSTSPADVAEQQATAFVPIYLAELDKLYSDPTVSINDIYRVAVQPESTREATAIARLRSANERQTGTSQLVKTSGASVHMAGLGGTSGTAKYPTVQLTACVDVSGVSVKDAKGKVLGSASRPKYLVESLTIVNIKYPDASGWRVSAAPNKQANTCDV